MAERTEGAEATLEQYLGRVRRALLDRDVDVAEVVADLRAHVESAASRAPQPVGEEAMAEILSRLGAPEEWAEAVPGGGGRPVGAGGEGAGAPPLPGWWGWGVLGLTAAGVLTFPWVGPLVLLVAWVAARAVLSRAEAAGPVDRSFAWLVTPAVVLNVGLLALLVVAVPVFPLAELAADLAPGMKLLAVAISLLAWWAMVALVALRVRGAVRWLIHPLEDLGHDRHRGAAVLAGALLLAAAGGATAQSPVWGTYEIEATFGGRTLKGEIAVWEGDAGAAGQLRLGSLPPAEVTGAGMSGDSMVVQLAFPEGPGRAVWLESDGAIEGRVEVGPNAVPFTGRRVETGGAVEDVAAALRDAIAVRAPDLLREAGEPGLGVAVVGSGAPWTAGFGVADRETGAPVTPGTLFQLGSISKTLTAWGVMALVESGRVELDRPADAYLKRWHFPDGEFDTDGVTIRRLLSHTAGVNVPSISGVDLDEAVPTLVEELQGRGDPDRAVRVVAEPGSGYAYSGGGYMVLQLLVEDVTGRDFADYMRETVLEPLGMASATFRWSDEVAGRVAMPTSPVDERDHRHRLFAGVAGAGLYASADDMAAFLAAHFPGPHGEPVGRGVLSPGAVRTLMTADPVAERYGLGYEVYPPVGETAIVGHGGSNVGWKANFILVPDLPLGVIVMSNADEGNARAGVVEIARDLILRALRP